MLNRKYLCLYVMPVSPSPTPPHNKINTNLDPLQGIRHPEASNPDKDTKTGEKC
jgi:hypothetical protein